MIRPAEHWAAGDLKAYPRNKLHTHLLLEAAAARGLSVQEPGGLLRRFFDHSRSCYLTGRRFASVSMVASRIARNKIVTAEILARRGIRTPGGRAFPADRYEEGEAFFRLLDAPAVVKPLAGAGGRGVHTNIQSLRDFKEAWAEVVRVDEGDVVIERFIAGQECRLFVVHDHVCAAALRHPARVEGDGRNTIAGLVATKSAQRRAIPYVGERPIRLTPHMLRRLEQAGMSAETLLPAGAIWQLHEISNISSGGESEDVTEQLHPEFAAIAVSSCAAIPGLGYAGVDILAENIKESPRAQRWAVCELNADPEFALHHFPLRGAARDVAGHLIEAHLRED